MNTAKVSFTDFCIKLCVFVVFSAIYNFFYIFAPDNCFFTSFHNSCFFVYNFIIDCCCCPAYLTIVFCLIGCSNSCLRLEKITIEKEKQHFKIKNDIKSFHHFCLYIFFTIILNLLMKNFIFSFHSCLFLYKRILVSSFLCDSHKINVFI